MTTVTTVDSARVPDTSSPSLDRVVETSRVVGPRMGQVTSGIPPSSTTLNALPPIDLTPNPPSNTFNPPPGSRVLALKSRVPSGGPVAPSGMGQLPPGIAAPHAHALPPGVSGLSGYMSEAVSPDMQFGGPRMTPSESSRGMRSFSPHSNGSQPNLPLEDLRESVHLAQMNEGLRRVSGPSAAERAILGLPGESGSPYGDLGGPQPGGFPSGGPLDSALNNVLGGANYAVNKGSRFAKFFDSKTRDAQVAVPRLGPQGPNVPPTIPHPNQRQVSMSMGGMGTPREERTMEDIFAMLQNSAQVRASVAGFVW